jgi:AcrR family transcriptional regulator
MKGSQTKLRIVENGMALFNKYGIHGTSISDLMRASELEKGGIYRHFASKEQILEESLHLYTANIEKRLTKATLGTNTARERLDAIIKSFVSIAIDPIVPGGCFIMNMAVDSDFDDSGPLPQVITSFKRWERLFVSEIQKGIKQGEFKIDTDAKNFAALAICSIEGSILLAGVYPKMQSSEIVSRHLMGLLDSYQV